MASGPSLIAVHPVLGSREVEISLRFFEKMGFTVTFQDDKTSPKYAVVEREKVELHCQWNEIDVSLGGEKPVYRFLVKDVDALFAEFLDNRAVEPERSNSSWRVPKDTPWGTREFHVRDPFGNGLQFYSIR